MTITIKGVRLERGKGYRIITEDELRRRVTKFASNSKWIEMIRKYGGKKLKVYDYDASSDRVWMSADHSDTYKWKPFMIAEVYNHGEKDEEPESAPSPRPQARTEDRADYRAAPCKKSGKKSLGKLILLMSLMNQKQPAKPAG